MLQGPKIRLSKPVLWIGLALMVLISPLRAEEEWRGVSNELLEAVRAQDMAALLSIFRSPEHYRSDEKVMAEVKGFFWDGEWIRWAIQDGKTIYEIAMSEDLVPIGLRQLDGTYLVIYMPKSQVSVMDSPGFLENQWMKKYFACEFGEVEGVWKLVKNLCFYGSGGPYQEPYG